MRPFIKVEDDPFFPGSSEEDEESDEEGTPTERARSRSPRFPKIEDWKTEYDPDTPPPPLTFRPLRTHGVQVDATVEHSPLSLFQLFFSPAVVQELCMSTNKYGAQSASNKSYTWHDVDVEVFYKFLGLVLYMSLVRLPNVKDYWKWDDLVYVPFPGTIMTQARFRSLTWNLHISDPEKDQENERKKGTPDYDELFCVQPLLDNIRAACKTSYHPRRELVIDERMVATKAETGFTQCMRNKPTKWGVKLFVLADSSNGYTVNCDVRVGKSGSHSDQEVSHDVVMNLVQPDFLGSGYHIYMDNVYTSPRLFTDLAALKFGACGMYRECQKGCPSSQGVMNESPHGTVRWIREGSNLFVKWMDTQVVSVCSTVHSAHAGNTVKRRIRDKDGKLRELDIPCPIPVLEYNKYMGGVDQLVQYCSAHKRASRWYRALFLHFLDIACTNAYVIHMELAAISDRRKFSHKDFLVELVSQLCGVEKTGIPLKKQSEHLPVPCAQEFNSSSRATVGRRRCKNCSSKGLRNITPWKCRACDAPLCLQVDRNCFMEFHGLQS